MADEIPAGVWYDAPNRRWRVRRYKNRKPYLAGYFDTLEEAKAAHAALSDKLTSIRQLRRGEREQEAPVAASLMAVAKAAALSTS